MAGAGCAHADLPDGCGQAGSRGFCWPDQVCAYGLPATEGKHGDPRRPVQWVEVLEPVELQRPVLVAVAP
ncbi:hypothetical protein PUR34_15305 [Streptomyces sp. JV185]|uniref:hypothetical protein n=1 Tax=Streptomyces sp. JV185 TaxID=858638 RepID=UPI002E78479C|nr:hypothetical protein [Streptomyces sp. JV185]MEE1769473.1 hypothetical protein [Streptomyces sp. JV185]